MALSPQALIRGIVNRLQPPINPDGANNDVAARQWSYGEICTQPMIRKNHALADEGAYFILHNNQTAIAPPTQTAFGATTPTLILQNLDPVRRLYLDYVKLTTITALTCTSGGGPMYASVVLDSPNAGRYSSGGTQLAVAPANPNMALSPAQALINAYFGAITASAASGAARTVVGQTMIRPNASASAITVIGDTIYMNFGGVEGAMGTSITLANPNFIPVPMPPVILGPNQTFLLYTYQATTTPVAGTVLPEVGFFLR